MLKWMVLPVALAGAMAANASGFCDDDADRPEWTGAGCPQARSSLPPASESSGGLRPDRKPALPNYSSLDLRPYYSTGYDLEPVTFTLELGNLKLLPAADNGSLGTRRARVLEFGLLSHELRKTGENGYRVLAMSVVRESGSATYSLDFSWIDDYALDLPTNVSWSPPSEQNAAVAQLSTSETSIVVTLAPVGTDWSHLGIRVKSYQRAWPHDVPLVFDHGNDFEMPALAQSGFTQPWALTSGIISGDLVYSGMTTSYLFTSPYIRTGE
jgi:hypothetical protein